MSYSFEERWEVAMNTAEMYPRFVDFAWDGMTYLIPGFTHMSPVQERICNFLQDGNRWRMVQAQRGEGKTYITALYCVWRWVHDPSLAILIVSAAQDLAEDITYLITQLVMDWDVMEYMRPAKELGDRKGMFKFDIHRALKGLNKQPSITAVPVLGTLPGKRVGLILADDIESNKNSMTATGRTTLIQRSKEFTRINTHGDVIFLGTPQSKDSVYNTLPSRGYELRIWPGRYPPPGDDKYGDKLCPEIRAEMEADPSLRTGGGIQGNMGKPTDPMRYTEEDLQDKELDSGPEDFALQYLLDTSLSDELRLQLKVRDLMVADVQKDNIPESLVWAADPKNAVPLPPDFPAAGASLYYGTLIAGTGFQRPETVWCAVDPAGQGDGADESVYIAATAVGNTIVILDMLAIRGGLSPQNEPRILGFLRNNGVTQIRCESNMGHGLFELGLRNMLAGSDLKHLVDSVSGEYSKGQKERRIIQSLRPLMERHRIAIHPDVIKADRECSRTYGIGERHHYSLFYQIANITTDRDSLPHDDRVDAMAMAVQLLAPAIMEDPQQAAERREQEKVREWLDNPLGRTVGWTNLEPPRLRHTVWGS